MFFNAQEQNGENFLTIVLVIEFDDRHDKLIKSERTIMSWKGLKRFLKIAFSNFQLLITFFRTGRRLVRRFLFVFEIEDNQSIRQK